jgi:hypothetical protein
MALRGEAFAQPVALIVAAEAQPVVQARAAACQNS